MPLYPPASGGGGGVAWTTGAANPAGGNPGDWYLQLGPLGNGVLWLNVAGTWTVQSKVGGAGWSRNQGIGWANNQPSGSLIISSLQASTCQNAFTGAVYASGVTTLTNGQAQAAAYGVTNFAAQYGINTLPPAGQVMNLYGGAYFGYSFPMVNITSAGAAILTDPFGSHYFTFSTAVAGDCFSFAGTMGAVIVNHVSSTGLIKEFALFAPGGAAVFALPSYWMNSGVLFGAGGYGAVSGVEIEVW